MHAGAVQAEVVDDDEFGVEQPQHEAHRNDRDHKARHVNPVVPRPPTPGGVQHGHHDVGPQSEERHRNTEESRLRRRCDDPAVDEPLVRTEECLGFEVRDREVRRERQTDQAQRERRDDRPGGDATERSIHLIFIAVFAAITPELEQTVAGRLLVSEQIAAVW